MQVDSTSLTFLGTLAGFLLAVIYDQSVKFVARRRELRAAGNIALGDGEWFAAWQTSVNNKPNLNVEKVKLTQRGAYVQLSNVEVSPDNVSGGFLWRAELKLYHGKKLMGSYMPADTKERDSLGVLYYVYHSGRKILIGQWVGAALDGDLCRGYSVIARSEDSARSLLSALVRTQPIDSKVLSDVGALIAPEKP